VTVVRHGHIPSAGKSKSQFFDLLQTSCGAFFRQAFDKNLRAVKHLGFRRDGLLSGHVLRERTPHDIDERKMTGKAIQGGKRQSYYMI